MDRILTARAALIVIAFVLAGFGIHNAFLAVFSQGRYEVIYNLDETVRTCIQVNCIYSAELAIANTGEEVQDLVTVTVGRVPGGIRGGSRVLNLSSAEPRAADPVIESSVEADIQTFRLSGFTPGTLVLIKFSGFYPVERNIDGRPEVTVSARGRIIEGDPRAVKLGRYVGSNHRLPALPIPVARRDWANVPAS